MKTDENKPTVEPGEELLIAQTIAKQIGRKTFFMLGAYDIYSDGGALIFKIRGCRKYRSIRIALVPVVDLYDMTFTNWKKNEITAVKLITGVDAETLHAQIEKYTGLKTKL